MELIKMEKSKRRLREPKRTPLKQITTTKIPSGSPPMDESQPQETEKKPSWVASITSNGLLIALVIAGVGYTTQVHITNKQKRQQAYSELLGEKAVIAQYLFSRFEAYIHAEFHQARWHLATDLQGFLDLQETKKLDLQETLRWMQKSEDLSLEVAKNTKSLFETLGVARSYFSLSPKLKDLTHRIFYAPKIEVEIPPSQLDPAHLEDWRVKERKRVQEIIEKDYIQPIDALLKYLEDEIDKEGL